MRCIVTVARKGAIKAIGFVALLGVTLFQHQAAHAQTAVDVELQLLLDTSGSISNSEYDLQMEGYAYSFRSQAVQDAILDTSNGSTGSIAVQTIMWSGSTQQNVQLDWTLLDSASAINSYADSLESLSRPFYGTTYTAEALEFGTSQFASNGFTGSRTVIDISGDGYGYDYMYGSNRWFSGESTSAMRDAALNAGIDTINGITITHDYYPVGDQDLTTWYANDVSGGENAFVMEASSFQDFGTALTTKLTAEIEGGYIPEEAVQSQIQTAPGPGVGVVAAFFLVGFYNRRRFIPKASRGSA